MFKLGDTTVSLNGPVDAQMRDTLNERGDAPFSLSLRARAGARTGTLDPTLTHGVRIEIVTDLESTL
jgi:hypothetical protein